MHTTRIKSLFHFACWLNLSSKLIGFVLSDFRSELRFVLAVLLTDVDKPPLFVERLLLILPCKLFGCMVTESGIFVAAVVVVMFCSEFEFPSRLTTICVLWVDEGDDGDMSAAMLWELEFDNLVIFRLFKFSVFNSTFDPWWEAESMLGLLIVDAFSINFNDDWNSTANCFQVHIQ